MRTRMPLLLYLAMLAACVPVETETGDDDATVQEPDSPAGCVEPASGDAFTGVRAQDDALALADSSPTPLPVPNDSDRDGVPIPEDCDDADASIYPGASESCDCRDNDCDGAVDHGNLGFLNDQDRDGFGTNRGDACAYVYRIGTRGDCDDADPGVHPGAADPDGDGIDQDCGGRDGRQPHRHLETSEPGTLQEAIAAARDGDIVWVGPYEHKEERIRFGGRKITLASTHPAANTTIEASAGPHLVFDDDEGPETVVDGFTLIAPSSALDAGSIRIDGAHPTIRGCTLRGLAVSDDSKSAIIEITGGGATFEACTFVGNSGAPVFSAINADLALHDCAWQDNSDDALLVTASTLTLSDCIVRGQAGRPLEASEGSPVSISRCTFEENGAGSYISGLSSLSVRGSTFADHAGHGLELDTATGSIRGSSFLRNRTAIEGSTYGGAIRMSGSSVVIEGCRFEDNLAERFGGAISLDHSNMRIERSTFLRNGAAVGGALYIVGGEPQLIDCQFGSNRASPVLGRGSGSGGAIYLTGVAGGSLERCAMVDNLAFGEGGGLYLSASSPSVDHCTLAGNVALSGGGGVFLENGALPEIRSSILAHNVGYNLYAGASSLEAGAATRVQYCDLFSLLDQNHNLDGLDASNLELDPRWISFRDDADSSDDLHLRPDSPLADAGDPAAPDPDGSPAELGIYGGPGADRTYYADIDYDGLYDGWEAIWGLDSAHDDAELDADEDGLSARDELDAATSPAAADSDGDGSNDGFEVSEGTDPTDFYRRPGTSGVVAQVPMDFPTVQAAVDAIRTSGTVELGAGQFNGSLLIAGREIVLAGAGMGETILESDGDPAMNVAWATLDLSDVSLQGSEELSIGLVLSSVQGRVDAVSVSGFRSTSMWAAGLSLRDSIVDFSNCLVAENTFRYDESDNPGVGAISIVDSATTFSGCQFSQNGTEESEPGAIRIERSTPVFTNCRFTGNGTGSSGEGAIHLEDSDSSFTNCRFSGNRGTYGGAIALSAGAATLSSCIFEGNSAYEYVPYPDGTVITQGRGGAIYGHAASDLFIWGCVLVDNEAAETGGGIFLTSDTTAYVLNSIFAENENGNLILEDPKGASVELRYTDLYASDGGTGANLASYDATVLNVAPGFLVWNQAGMVNDLHLGIDSPLVDAGEPTAQDADGSPIDPGAYGGPDGNGWDLDGDGVQSWFWPGTIADAPDGFDPAYWDCDDLDETVQRCAG